MQKWKVFIKKIKKTNFVMLCFESRILNMFDYMDIRQITISRINKSNGVVIFLRNNN